jgi:hypothetical protein
MRTPTSKAVCKDVSKTQIAGCGGTFSHRNRLSLLALSKRSLIARVSLSGTLYSTLTSVKQSATDPKELLDIAAKGATMQTRALKNLSKNLAGAFEQEMDVGDVDHGFC